MEFNDWLFESVVLTKAHELARVVAPRPPREGRFAVVVGFSPRGDDVENWSRKLREMDATVDEPGDSWSVRGTRGAVEVATPHLALRDLPLLGRVLESLRGEELGAATTRVQVGMPRDPAPFDRLVIATLVDESLSLMGDRSDPPLPEVLYDLWDPGVHAEVPALRPHLGRPTVEFRCASAEVARDPCAFCNWIEYFLLMPSVVGTRREIRLNAAKGDITIARDGDGIRVAKTVRNEAAAAKTPDAFPRRLAEVTFGDLEGRMPPQHRAHMTVALRNLFPHRDLARTPVVAAWDELPPSLRRMISGTSK